MSINRYWKAVSKLTDNFEIIPLEAWDASARVSDAF